MVSTGIQVDIADPEGLLGVIRSSHSQLEELMTVCQSLLEMNKSREDRVRLSAGMSSQLTERVEELLDRAQTMITRIDNDTSTVSSSEQELQDLLSEKGIAMTMYSYSCSISISFFYFFPTTMF